MQKRGARHGCQWFIAQSHILTTDHELVEQTRTKEPQVIAAELARHSGVEQVGKRVLFFPTGRTLSSGRIFR